MAAAPNLEVMNEHEGLQEVLEPNIAQEPIQGIFIFSTWNIERKLATIVSSRIWENCRIILFSKSCKELSLR